MRLYTKRFSQRWGKLISPETILYFIKAGCILVKERLCNNGVVLHFTRGGSMSLKPLGNSMMNTITTYTNWFYRHNLVGNVHFVQVTIT